MRLTKILWISLGGSPPTVENENILGGMLKFLVFFFFIFFFLGGGGGGGYPLAYILLPAIPMHQ